MSVGSRAANRLRHAYQSVFANMKRKQSRRGYALSHSLAHVMRFEPLEDRRMLSTVFSDNFEGSHPGAWSIGHDGGGGNYSWAWPNDYAHNYAHPSNGQYYYPNDLHVYMERSGVSLSGYDSASLSFNYIVDTEPGYDHFTVNVRDQNRNWHELWANSGTTDPLSWSSKTLSLDSFAGQSNLDIQFRFDSDGSQSGSPYDGVFIDNVSLTATVQNDPPTASRQSPTNSTINIPAGTTQSFTVLGQDSDGNLDFVDWYLNGGQPQVQHNMSGFSDADTWSHTFDTAGTYTIEAMAFDDGTPRLYSNPPATWTVNVLANRAPTASRQSPTNSTINIPAGTTQSFTALGQDSDGNLDFVDWYLNGGQPQVQHNMSGSSDADSWNHTFDTAGTYTVEAMVFDSGAPKLYSNPPATWTVNVLANRAPTASRQSPTTSTINIPVGTTQSFTALGQDSDGNLDFVDWYLNGGQPQVQHNMSGSSDADSWNHTFDTAGTYTVEAMVFDSGTPKLYSNPPATWTVNVLANRAPTASRQSPTSPTITIPWGTTQTFQVQANDADGNLDWVDWYLQGGSPRETDDLQGSSDTATWSYTFNTSGTYTVEAQVFDSGSPHLYSNPPATWTVIVGEPPRGMYVDYVNRLLSDRAMQLSLLEYSAQNNITYLAFYVSASHPYWNTPGEAVLSDFIQLAKGSYGIEEVGLIGGSTADFDKYVFYADNHPGEIDVLNLEKEFWHSGDYTAYKNILQYAANVASTHNLRVETYVAGSVYELALPNESQMKEIAGIVDRLLLEVYVTDPESIVSPHPNYPSSAYDYLRQRLLWAGDSEHDVTIWPIFSAESSYDDASPTQEYAFMGDWLKTHSLLEAENAFLDDYANDTDPRRLGVNVGGFQYYAYQFMSPLLFVTASSFYPQHNNTDVAVDADLQITFADEDGYAVNMTKGTTGHVTIRRAADGAVVETIPVGDDRVTVTGNTVTINPFSDLVAGTRYSILVDPTCFDGIGEAATESSYPGISIPGVWQFTTEQNIAPVAQIDSVSPNPSQPPGQTIEFHGTGSDSDGNIVAWNWVSDLDGELSNAEDFNISSRTLTVGNHQIYFRVQDDALAWSETDVYELIVLNALPNAELNGIPSVPVPSGSQLALLLGGYDNDENGERSVAGELEVWLGPALIASYPAAPGQYILNAPVAEGIYTLSYRVKDDEGTWSNSVTDTFAVFETTPPTVVGWEIGNGTAQRSTIASVRIQFSEDVSASLTMDRLVLENLTAGETIAPADMARSYNPGTDTAEWTFPGLSGGRLPDGNYAATLLATGITDGAGNELQEDYEFAFHTFFGDADGDRDVDFADLFKFRKTYQKDSTDPAFNPIFDVDADDDVDFADLFKFRRNYQNTLEVPYDLVVSDTELTVPEGSTADFTVELSAQPLGTVTVTTARTDGDEDLSVDSGGTLLFDNTNWNIPQPVTIAAAEDADLLAGSITLTISSAGSSNSPTVLATEIDNDNTTPGEGWNNRRADLAGTNYYPYGSEVQTSNSLQLESTIGTTDAISLTGDVDGDGKLELVRVEGDQLSIYDETGQLQTQQTLPTAGTLSMLGDVDGDGVLDIGIGGKEGNATTAYCYFYDGDGVLLQTFERSVGYDGAIYPTAVTSPGKVLVQGGAGYSKNPRGLFLYDYNTGNEDWSYGLGFPSGHTSAADIDGDGKLESTVGWATAHNGHSVNGTTDGELYLTITDDDGTNLLTQKYPSPDNGYARHIFSDLNQDGTYEILAIERHHPTYYNGADEVHLYDLAGNTLHTYTGPMNEYWLWATADIDNDGHQNVVVGGYSVLTVLDDQLQEVRSIDEDGFVQLVADLTGNGYREIVTINSGNLLRVYDYELNLLDSIQLTGDARTDGGAVASDIDADGIVELVVQSSAGSHVVSFSPEGPAEIVVPDTEITVPEGDTSQFTVSLSAESLETISVAIAQTDGDEDLNIDSGGTLTFDGTVPQPVTLAAAENADAIDGTATFTVTAETASTPVVVMANEQDDGLSPGQVHIEGNAMWNNRVYISWQNTTQVYEPDSTNMVIDTWKVDDNGDGDPRNDENRIRSGVQSANGISANLGGMSGLKSGATASTQVNVDGSATLTLGRSGNDGMLETSYVIRPNDGNIYGELNAMPTSDSTFWWGIYQIGGVWVSNPGGEMATYNQLYIDDAVHTARPSPLTAPHEEGLDYWLETNSEPDYVSLISTEKQWATGMILVETPMELQLRGSLGMASEYGGYNFPRVVSISMPEGQTLTAGNTYNFSAVFHADQDLSLQGFEDFLTSVGGGWNTPVNAANIIATPDNPPAALSPAAADNRLDVNRDGRVDAIDLILVRDNVTSPSTVLQLIERPSTVPAPPSSADAEGRMFRPTGEGESMLATRSLASAGTPTLESLDGLMAARADQPAVDSLLPSPILSKLLRRLGSDVSNSR